MKWARQTVLSICVVLFVSAGSSSVELHTAYGVGSPRSVQTNPATEQASLISPSVLSTSQLTPPLRTPLKALRFSPDGRYILLQDEATIYVLIRDPLSVRFQVDASDAAPARFSPDSQKLVIPTYTMGVEWRSLPDGKIIQTTTLAPDGSCYEARLSPRGDLYGCIDRDLDLRVFNIAKCQQVFAQKIGDIPYAYMTPERPEEPVAIPKWWTALRYRPVLQTFLQFSPDDRYVLATTFRGQIIAVDLLAGGRMKLPEPFSRALDDHVLQFIAPGRVLLGTADEPGTVSVASFPDGVVQATLPVPGRAGDVSDPRYALITNAQSKRLSVTDWKAASVVQELPPGRADVLNNLVVRYDSASNGFWVIQDANPKPAAQVLLPVGSISAVFGAAVSSDLGLVAVGTRGEGGVYQTATGQRVARVDNLEGTWFDGNARCYVEVHRSDASVGLEVINLLDGSISTDPPAWFLAIDQSKARLMFSGQVAISIVAPSTGCCGPESDRKPPSLQTGVRDVVFEEAAGGAKPSSSPVGDTISITAFDIGSGSQMWTRQYYGSHTEWDSPHEGQMQPFADPQGDRVVFGLYANTHQAWVASKRASSAVQHEMKTAKISEHDSFLEVLDARTGATVGGVLLKRGTARGTGLWDFDGISSAGNWLILEEGGRRFRVYSLSSGVEVLRSFALYATLSGDSGLLALAEEHGLLSVYSLKTAAKVAEYRFPDDVVYMHFSADERRLLAVTKRQSLYILDSAGLADSVQPKP